MSKFGGNVVLAVAIVVINSGSFRLRIPPTYIPGGAEAKSYKRRSLVSQSQIHE